MNHPRTRRAVLPAPLGALLALVALLGATALPPGAGVPAAAASTCGEDVAGGDVAALRTAVARAQDAATDAGCTSWELRVSGTYTVAVDDGPIVHTGAVDLHIVGPVGGVATITAGGVGTRLLDAVDETSSGSVGSLHLERLVLTGADVSAAGAPSGGRDRRGGAVDADVLSLVDVELRDNRAYLGGAVHVGDLTAVRTSFVDNAAVQVDPAGGPALGGAVFADGLVTLVNVTFDGNASDEGGAIALDLMDEDSGLDATFVTFVGNLARDVGGAADLQVESFTTDATSVTLRGVLFGGPASRSDDTIPDACAFLTVAPDVLPTLTSTASLATDASCGTGSGSVIAVPTFGTVPFLAAGTGTTDLQVPTGDWPGLDGVACSDATGAPSGGWPTTDQRGLARPQGAAGACDVGAVERRVTVSVEGPDPVPPADPPSTVVDEVEGTLACSPPVVGAGASCDLTATPSSTFTWEASTNPVFATGEVTTDAAGVGSFSFEVPASLLGRPIVVQVIGVAGSAVPIGVASAAVPSGVPAGEGRPLIGTGGPPAGVLVGALVGVLVMGRAVRRREPSR